MNWKKIIGIAFGIILAALVVVKLKNNKEITKGKVYQYEKDKAIPVQGDTIRIESLETESSYTGTFEPNKETKISAELQGKINAVLVDVGSVVHKGQALVQLDHSLLNLQLQSIAVQIEGLTDDVHRNTILAKADAIQGVQLEKSELSLRSAKLQRASIQEQINKGTIKAPFAGVVTAKLCEAGSFAAPGVPLLQISDINTLRFSVNVPEKELYKFQLNQIYPLKVDAYTDILLTGKATMIGSKANMGSSFPVQFTTSNTADLKIKSGMFGKVHLKMPLQEKGILIPASAVIGTANSPQIYLIKNGQSSLQNITISRNIQNKVVVSSGLTEGDVIVTNGLINLFDGAKVSVK